METTPINKHSGNKYVRTIHSSVDQSTCQVDVYSVLEAFGVTCPARQHALKKLLCTGLRSKGNQLQDLKECRDAIDRAIELQKKREGQEPPAQETKEEEPNLEIFVCPTCKHQNRVPKGTLHFRCGGECNKVWHTTGEMDMRKPIMIPEENQTIHNQPATLPKSEWIGQWPTDTEVTINLNEEGDHP